MDFFQDIVWGRGGEGRSQEASKKRVRQGVGGQNQGRTFLICLWFDGEEKVMAIQRWGGQWREALRR